MRFSMAGMNDRLTAVYPQNVASCRTSCSTSLSRPPRPLWGSLRVLCSKGTACPAFWTGLQVHCLRRPHFASTPHLANWLQVLHVSSKCSWWFQIFFSTGLSWNHQVDHIFTYLTQKLWHIQFRYRSHSYDGFWFDVKKPRGWHETFSYKVGYPSRSS